MLKGHYSSYGFLSSRTPHPDERDAPLIKTLRDAGAVFYVKTNQPQGIMHLEVSTRSAALRVMLLTCEKVGFMVWSSQQPSQHSLVCWRLDWRRSSPHCHAWLGTRLGHRYRW